MMEGSWLYHGDHYAWNIESLCCKPETNIILCVNYNSVEILEESKNVPLLTNLGTYVCVIMEWSLGHVNMTYCWYKLLWILWQEAERSSLEIYILMLN